MVSTVYREAAMAGSGGGGDGEHYSRLIRELCALLVAVIDTGGVDAAGRVDGADAVRVRDVRHRVPPHALGRWRRAAVRPRRRRLRPLRRGLRQVGRRRAWSRLFSSGDLCIG
uniref:Uncharacterized protein n=1 Tax=Oryza brachyantha TaxID=4533 RepID=J3L7A5_ORYBR